MQLFAGHQDPEQSQSSSSTLAVYVPLTDCDYCNQPASQQKVGFMQLSTRLQPKERSSGSSDLSPTPLFTKRRKIQPKVGAVEDASAFQWDL